MRITAFIPARYESTRFPGKPLAPIVGRPMIRHVYERACSCRCVDEVLVATDDERIVHQVTGFGGKAVMTAKEHFSGSDRIAEAAAKAGLGEDDLILNVQGDQPLFEPSSVEDLVRPFRDGDAAVVMSTLKCRITERGEITDPNIVKVVTDSHGWALFFSRSPIPYYRDGEPDPVFYKHLGFYAYRLGFLKTFARLKPGALETAEKLEQLRALENGFRIKVIETPYDSIEIDSPRDIEKVENIIARQNPRSP